jgi:Ca2+/Na+ antiporter
MILDLGILILALLFIVASAELFTNGIEWLGQRLGLSEGVVGSVLAAVGTAMPETLIPIVAVLFFSGRGGEKIGIGAILGAPFMLSTLTLGLCGMAAIMFAKQGIRNKELQVDTKVVKRDLKFFITAYVIAMLAAIPGLETPAVKYAFAFGLLSIYPFYLYKTFQAEGEVGEEPDSLYLDKLLKLGPKKLRLILPQVFLGLAGIVGGAYYFVEVIKDIADVLDVPALILSLIIAPIATELPEKINSILWVRQGKDTLAMGNVTGALVFQSCIPVAFGVAFTPWDLDVGTVLTGVTAITSATIVLSLILAGKLKFLHLAFGAALYAAAVTALLILDGHGAAHSAAH